MSKNHTPYEQLCILDQEGYAQQNMKIETPYLDPKLWKLVPNEYKTIKSLADFKTPIKAWVREKYLCRLCRTYIDHTSFI